MAAPTMTPAQAANAAMQQNLAARAFILKNAINCRQQIFQQTYSSSVAGTVINVPLRNVGLLKRLLVYVQAQISGVAAHTNTLTPLGMSNFFSQVVFTDLSNNVRVQTTGWHLMAVSSAKRRWPFGASIVSASTDTPNGYGNNFTTTMAAPSTLTATASSNNCYAVFEVPIAYSDTDLRGAIFASVLNATMNLQLTINPNIGVKINTSGGDYTKGVYYADDGVNLVTLNAATITVYQEYLDQIPVVKGNYVLPPLDLGTAYELKNTSIGGLVVSQDNAIPFSNFRDFLSTCVIYDNDGLVNAGSDLNSIALQSANFTNIFKSQPEMISLDARNRIHEDFPKGMYYHDFRSKPLSTQQYGNLELLYNIKTLTTTNSVGNNLQVGFEDLAIINQVVNAGSLPSAG